MSKRIIFIELVTLSFIIFPALIQADQHYDQYPGSGFVPPFQATDYIKDASFGYIYHNDTNDEGYMCPVTFKVPDGSTYFIKSIGMRFKDDLENGYLRVWLIRKNLYTGNIHTVAYLTSSGASESDQTASQGTIDGFKLIDTKKFVYWLSVYFNVLGDVNPSNNLILYQVRIHYGT